MYDSSPYPLPNGGGGQEPVPSVPSMTVSSHVLPEQHEDQVQLGFRMIQNAYTSKVQSLENELKGLRFSCDQQKQQVTGLQRKNSQLEVEVLEGQQKTQQLTDENKELLRSVQSLKRQLQRLEGLKKRVLDTISDDANADYSIESQEASLAMRDDLLHSNLPLTMNSFYSEQQANDMQLRGMGTPGMQTPGTASAAMLPPAASTMPNTAVSSRAPSPPRATAPPGSQAGHDAGSTHGGGAGMIDGKQFFRQARTQLSYQKFNDFLTNIKQLNNGAQTREQTLEEARRIFGPELKDLYSDFENLLSRQTM